MTAVTPPSFVEWCRECRDEDEATPAILIIWGKLFPPEALGPKCADHAYKYLPDLSPRTIGQWAVFDLRGLVREEASA